MPWPGIRPVRNDAPAPPATRVRGAKRASSDTSRRGRMGVEQERRGAHGLASRTCRCCTQLGAARRQSCLARSWLPGVWGRWVGSRVAGALMVVEDDAALSEGVDRRRLHLVVVLVEAQPVVAEAGRSSRALRGGGGGGGAGRAFGGAEERGSVQRDVRAHSSTRQKIRCGGLAASAPSGPSSSSTACLSILYPLCASWDSAARRVWWGAQRADSRGVVESVAGSADVWGGAPGSDNPVAAPQTDAAAALSTP